MSSSLAKCGGGGYGYSKPQMKYHCEKSDSVTTVVSEISRMTVHEKPTWYGAVQEEDDDVVYYSGGGGTAVHKGGGYAAGHQQQHHGTVVVDGGRYAQKYGYGSHQQQHAGGYDHDSAVMQKKHRYVSHGDGVVMQKQQQHGDLTHQYKVEHESDCSEEDEESDCEEEELAHGGYQQQAYNRVEKKHGGSETPYVSYESTTTTTKGYYGGGGWAQRKNRC